MRNINNALRKNRNILESNMKDGDEFAKTTKEQLLQNGFQFKYLTHLSKNKSGTTYFFCYDYAYLPLEDDWYLLLKAKEILRG